MPKAWKRLREDCQNLDTLYLLWHLQKKQKEGHQEAMLRLELHGVTLVFVLHVFGPRLLRLTILHLRALSLQEKVGKHKECRKSVMEGS